MLVKTVNIWGAITACDDKIIIEEVETVDSKPTKTFYIVKEKSYEIAEDYTYDNLPTVLEKLIHLCNAVVKQQGDQLILYGPNLSKGIGATPIYQFPLDYFTTSHEITKLSQDKKIEHVLKWLEMVVQNYELKIKGL